MGSTIDELSRDGTTLDVDSIREKFNAAVAEMGVPLAKIAPATGVAYATLSAWKNGTYGGDNQRIAADVQKWLVTREAGARMNIALPKAPSRSSLRPSDGVAVVFSSSTVLMKSSFSSVPAALAGRIWHLLP